MSCPRAALGLFIGLILYDHRRAIAWSKLISSKRQWVKGKKKLHWVEGGGRKITFRWLLVTRKWDQQVTNVDRGLVPNTCLAATAFARRCFNMSGVKRSGSRNANRTIMSSPCFAKQTGLASVGGVGCLTRTNAVYESRVFASNHIVYSQGPASASCFPSDW